VAPRAEYKVIMENSPEKLTAALGATGSSLTSPRGLTTSQLRTSSSTKTSGRKPSIRLGGPGNPA
jgi:hypothetical protein